MTKKRVRKPKPLPKCPLCGREPQFYEVAEDVWRFTCTGSLDSNTHDLKVTGSPYDKAANRWRKLAGSKP